MSNADIRFIVFGISCFILGVSLAKYFITSAYLKKMEEEGMEAFTEGLLKAAEKTNSMTLEEFKETFGISLEVKEKEDDHE